MSILNLSHLTFSNIPSYCEVYFFEQKKINTKVLFSYSGINSRNTNCDINLTYRPNKKPCIRNCGHPSSVSNTLSQVRYKPFLNYIINLDLPLRTLQPQSVTKPKIWEISESFWNRIYHGIDTNDLVLQSYNLCIVTGKNVLLKLNTKLQIIL
jgi:hypothetical protein